MANGRKTGGRQKGTLNKATIGLDRALAEATVGLTFEQITVMTPLDIMIQAMRIEAATKQWRVAAALAEKVAPYFHAKIAPKSDHGEGYDVTVRITGGLPVD
jgi:hypothetical protein